MCYVISKFITDDLFNDIFFHRDHTSSREATVTGKGQGRYKPESRKARIKNISHSDYPDYSKDLVNHMLPLFNESIIPSDYEVNEFNYLIYDEPGNHFVRHRDNDGTKWYDMKSFSNWKQGEEGSSYRTFSAITLMSVSEDLVGGNLILWDDNGEIVRPKLKVKETILFDASRHHQVTPIISGKREALISWIYKI